MGRKDFSRFQNQFFDFGLAAFCSLGEAINSPFGQDKVKDLTACLL